MTALPSQQLPSRVELFSPELKRSLVVMLRPYSAGRELTVTLWIHGQALAQASAYVTEDKGVRLQQRLASQRDDSGDMAFMIGRTTFSILNNEVLRLKTFFSEQNIAVQEPTT